MKLLSSFGVVKLIVGPVASGNWRALGVSLETVSKAIIELSNLLRHLVYQAALGRRYSKAEQPETRGNVALFGRIMGQPILLPRNSVQHNAT